MSNPHFVGVETARPDAADKVSGRTQYIHDLAVPGMLWGAIRFSDHAHARIKHVDTSAAEKLPGVEAVITGYNTPEVRIGFVRDNFALKRDKVRQFRDEIAAVAARDPETARAAAALVRVEYEPLPGVFSLQEALAPGAVLVHETDAKGRPRKDNLVPVRFAHHSGDLEAGKRASKHIVEGEYRVPLIQQSCMGTAGCIASFDTRGNLTLIAKTQIPFLAQKDFNRALGALGLEGRNTRVVVPALGGGFGTGLDTHAYEYIAMLLAWRTGRPVKILYNREEEFAYLSPRQSATARIRQGCDANGKLTFREIEVTQDNGAYTSWGATFPSVMLVPATSLYRVQNISFESKIVYTNNTYCQAMRGYGNPEITWPIESSMDELAELAGLDPVEMRLLNSNQPGETTPMGLKITTCGLQECLERTAAGLNWKENRGKRRNVKRGFGLAGLINVAGGGKIYRSDGSGIILKPDDYGNVNVSYGGVEMGQGLHSVLALTIADTLGVRPEQVIVNQTDTSTCPWDVGTHASRGAFMACNAAVMAARKLKARLLEWAEEIFPVEVEEALAKARKHPGFKEPDFDWRGNCRPGCFELSDGILTIKGAPAVPELQVDFARLLRAIHFRRQGGGTTFAEEAFYEPPTELPDWEKGIGNMSATYAFGAQGVEVEVDEDTGEVKILRLVAAHDVGRVLNPQTLKGQIYGGLAQGIGYALYEEVLTDKGRILNPGFTDYKLPTAVEMGFPIDVQLVQTNDPEGPFGAKGVGEPGLVPTAPAIANAVYDAVGVRIRELPITPEKVLKALQEKRRR
ncbi:MAG: xanthine dehydrogenase family protein molybdopterin-binding subunit [Planctomycetes bacterium]|nr:xanthine dehydrogenase family protein molybdopterin-binding subunit [Planctomycetota bacterium]